MGLRRKLHLRNSSAQALYRFDLFTVHKLSSNEKKYRQSRVSNPGLLGEKRKRYLCASPPPELLEKKSGLLELDEAEHGVDPALVVVELEDAAGDDGVDVGAEN